MTLPTLLILLACTESATPTDDGRPTLRLGGAETLTDQLMPALAETHRRARGTLNFEVRRGKGDGLAQLLDGEIDVAATTRPHRPKDQEQAKERGFSLDDEGARHVIGVDVVALAIHPSNVTDSLTYDQVIGIFCDGPNRIDDWSHLGLDARPIRALARDPSDGSRAVFEDFFCGGRGLSRKVEIVNPQTMQNALEDDTSVVAVLSMSEEAGKVVGLRPDAAQPPIRPSQQQVIRGAYPLYRDVYLYTAGPAKGDVAAFIEWVEAPAGQEVLDEQRLVPLYLRPERLDEPRPLRETIHFEPGSSEPNQRSSARLQLLVSELKQRAGEYRHIVLEGFTDDREPESIALSRARAEAVKGLLAAELPGVYFEIIPRGSRNPIAPNETDYGRQRNRRVQVYLAEEEAPEPPATEEVVEGG